MKFTTITADSGHALLCDDGSITLVDALVDVLEIELREHGHFGNLMYHVSQGDRPAVKRALRSILLQPVDAGQLCPLGRNLVTMLSGTGPDNLRPLRPWLLDRIEARTTSLYRHSLERRIDALAAQIEGASFVFTRSALRILSGG